MSLISFGEKLGLLRVCPGNKVNKYHMLEWFKGNKGRI